MSAALTEFFRCYELLDMLSLIHQPVECRHLKLLLQLVADDLTNPRIVFIQPFFLIRNVKFQLSPVFIEEIERENYFMNAEQRRLDQLGCEWHESRDTQAKKFGARG